VAAGDRKSAKVPGAGWQIRSNAEEKQQNVASVIHLREYSCHEIRKSTRAKWTRFLGEISTLVAI